MDSAESQLFLTGTTWQETETTSDEADFVVLPCGATERYSMHLPTSVDFIQAENLTAELTAAALECDLNFLVLPVLSCGYLEHHVNYAGMISLGTDTYQEITIDAGRSV